HLRPLSLHGGCIGRHRHQSPSRRDLFVGAVPQNAYYSVDAGCVSFAPPNKTPLNRNLNVACGWPRNATSGPSSTTLPEPSAASATATPPSRYCWPHAQPLCRGVPLANQATGWVPLMPESGLSRKTGLLSKKTSTWFGMPYASGFVLSTLVVNNDPGI